jgi:NTP pyrophosphatase (non-canonical NTP hydrolase)
VSKSLYYMRREVREVNTKVGWYPANPPNTFGDYIALLHSEVSEMFEAYRNWGLEDATKLQVVWDVLPKPEGVGSEAADVLIRLLDMCEEYGIDLEKEYERKLAYNRTRPYRHGGKKI